MIPDRAHPEFVTGLVLAAGASQRLGQPKQLLPLGGRTLLGHVLDVARGCRFDQLLCVVGAAADAVRAGVDVSGVELIENRQYGEGCSSSIAAALTSVSASCDVLVLMLGDQPGVTARAVATLLAGRRGALLGACSYIDGRGHPLAFARAVFGDLEALHGDRGVWKLLDRRSHEVVDVPMPGAIPLDVDTWADYEQVLEQVGRRPA